MLASPAADRMLSAASRKNTVLSVAASFSLSGGTNRVFVLPGIDALAMTAIAQVERKCQSSPSPMNASTSFWCQPRQCQGAAIFCSRQGDGVTDASRVDFVWTPWGVTVSAFPRVGFALKLNA